VDKPPAAAAIPLAERALFRSGQGGDDRGAGARIRHRIRIFQGLCAELSRVPPPVRKKPVFHMIFSVISFDARFPIFIPRTMHRHRGPNQGPSRGPAAA
jgi:hypothetical protein